MKRRERRETWLVRTPQNNLPPATTERPGDTIWLAVKTERTGDFSIQWDILEESGLTQAVLRD